MPWREVLQEATDELIFCRTCGKYMRFRGWSKVHKRDLRQSLHGDFMCDNCGCNVKISVVISGKFSQLKQEE